MPLLSRYRAVNINKLEKNLQMNDELYKIQFIFAIFAICINTLSTLNKMCYLSMLSILRRLAFQDSFIFLFSMKIDISCISNMMLRMNFYHY